MLNIMIFKLTYFAVIFGEDVAFGGVFRCTVGLADKYGEYALCIRLKELNLEASTVNRGE